MTWEIVSALLIFWAFVKLTEIITSVWSRKKDPPDGLADWR